MASMEQEVTQQSTSRLITDNLDIWTAAIVHKSGTGRGASKKYSLHGIQRLRELILELAVRGRLIPQDETDEPASVLLERIAEEKVQLVKEGKIKKTKALPAIGEDEKPFELPVGWEWCRIGNLSEVQAGFAFKSKEFNESGIGLPLIRIRDVGQEFSGTYYSGEYREEFLVSQGDYLISMDGNFRVASWDNKPALLNQRVSRLLFYIPNLGENFIAQSLQLKLSQLQGVKAYTTVDHLSGGQITNSIVALPPLQEQHRIVAKVDELMHLCDALEAQTIESISAHQTLVETLLDALLIDNQRGDSFAENWQRVLDHFDTLFTTTASIDTLKQTILQLAVMGKLVPQDASDEPASKLLERIAEEKAQLIKNKKIKKQKPLPAISEDEKPFALPVGWEWCRLQDSLDIRDGTHDSPKDAIGDDTFPLITSKNFIDGEIDFENARRISKTDHDEIIKRSLVEVDDILFSMIGGNIGNQVLVKDPRQFSIKNVALFKYFDKQSTFPKYIKIYTEELAIKFQNQAAGGAQPFVSLGKIRSLVLALPPLQEQHRIVAKVDELMSLCDELKARLQQAQEKQVLLTDAIVTQAL